MTDDLVERLRKQAYFADRSAEDAFNEAADRIEALEAKVERLREALTTVYNEGDFASVRIATLALGAAYD